MAPKGASTWRRPYTSIYNNNYKYGTGLYSDTLTDIEKRYADSMSRTQLRSNRPDLAFQSFSGSTLTSSPNPAGESSYNTMEPRSSLRESRSDLRESRSNIRESRSNVRASKSNTRESKSSGRDSSVVFSRQVSSSSPEVTRSPTFEHRLNATLSSAAGELDDDMADAIRARIARRKQQMLARSEEYKSQLEDDEPVRSRPTSLYDDSSSWTLAKSSQKFADLDLDRPKSKRKTAGRVTPTNGPSSQWRDKSRNLQDQVESLEKSMSDASSRLRNELSSLKSRYHTETSDLGNCVESTSQQANELQKQCKRQASQITSLQSAYDEAEGNISTALDEMSVWQNKCKYLKKEMDRLKEEVETAISRKSKA